MTPPATMTPPGGAGGDDRSAAERLAALERGTTGAAALAFLDRLPALTPAGLTGRWRGTGLLTGHRWDGLLETHGWYGKEVLDAETVHPLLFRDRAGVPRPVDPTLAPLGLLRAHPGLFRNAPARLAFARVRPLLHTRRPAARVRTLEHRGVPTAALVYDRLPIVDVFRRVTADTVLGVMDLRGLTEPFFFVLRRERYGP
jgi:hypothetical protein